MITIDVQSRSVHKDGREVVIRSKLLFNMLLYLTTSNGMVRTRDDIIQHCWDSKIVTKRNIDIRLCELRKIIGDPSPGKVIIGVKGVGYKVDPKKIRLVNQNGVAPKPKSNDGYVFVQHATFKGEPVVVLANIKDVDDWIIIPKSEYE